MKWLRRLFRRPPDWWRVETERRERNLRAEVRRLQRLKEARGGNT